MINDLLCQVQNEILGLGLTLKQTNIIMRKILQKIGLDY